MIAILSAFIGFFSSFLPEILHFLKDKKDKEHELKLIDLQLKALKTGHSVRRLPAITKVILYLALFGCE
ncbi:MAG: hypothetical protein LN568_04825 [Rickettsia endosymbiont of Pseudomimeciton antennatum]|nr:hypothetical protein [Rickettsia endosymbiont of Pseudomimeciton antennatum]MCC8398377.1 hypothetical protein [Rickettsia endosymbiont of Labidopullus appendiculatus]